LGKYVYLKNVIDIHLINTIYVEGDGIF